VVAVADAPTLTADDAFADEGSAVPLNVAAALTDADGSESLSVEVSGVPSGLSLSAGTDLGSGTWRLTPPQLVRLTPSASPDDASFALTVTATSTEASNGSAASAGATVNVTVRNKAPSNVALSLSAAAVNEGDSVTLGGSFADPGVLDTHTVSIDWGDGS